MTQIKSVCVYCGASQISNPRFNAPTDALGAALAKAGITLVYGGGSPGLMGRVANAALAEGGKVVGVIPEHILKIEVRHNSLTELYVVPSMHIRKQMMAERADAFVIFPGGIGTLEEAFEILTWRFLGIHDKPVIVANIDGYWDPFLRLFDHMGKEGFTRQEHRDTFVVANNVDEVMAILKTPVESTEPVQVDKI